MKEKKVITVSPVAPGELHTFDTILHSYYAAIKHGDMQTLRTLMTEQSYIMNIEAFGLKRAFIDARFKTMLAQCKDDAAILREVEVVLCEDLISEASHPSIVLTSIEDNGSGRRTVLYTENGNPKKLYLSFHSDEWLIDYMAGRRRS